MRAIDSNFSNDYQVNSLPDIEFKIESRLIPYEEALSFMEKRVAEIANGQAKEMVWLLEHPPLYTAGTSADDNDLLDVDKFPVYKTGRGGEYTYHGPGQRIAYVMLDLKRRGRQDIRLYINNLEQWVINTLKNFGIEGERRLGRVGIWVNDSGSENKIAAIGVRVRKWVTFHGIAINVDPNLDDFSGIVPCGISNYGVTSMCKVGKKISLEQLDSVLKGEFYKVFCK